MKISKDSIIGELVADNYKTVQVFKQHKIDFCCKGNRSIEEACKAKKIDSSSLITELGNLTSKQDSPAIDYNAWPIDLLVDYIEKTHHRYVVAQTPILIQYLDKICEVHGQQHPELHEITAHFKASAEALVQHMKKEELVLFPFVRKLMSNALDHTEVQTPQFGTVKNPIHMMMEEHENEGERFRLIDELSNGYTPPSDACNTYIVAFKLLQEFEADLHLHIHLENNVLFPKAIALEAQVHSSI